MPPTPSLGGRILAQLIVILVCVGVPAFVTGSVPVSWISLERRDGQTSATVRTCLLFIIPYRTTTISPVTRLDDRVRHGQTRRQSRTSTKQVTEEDKGYLTIHGENDQAVEILVSPVSLPSVLERANAFLNDPQATRQTLFVAANWKVSVIIGGLLSLLTVLYVTSITLGLLVTLIRRVQALVGVPPENRLFVSFAVRRAARRASRNRT